MKAGCLVLLGVSHASRALTSGRRGEARFVGRRLRMAWTVVAGANGQGRMSVQLMVVEMIQRGTRASRGGGRVATAARCHGCSTGALATLWTCPWCVRRNANGIYRDSNKLTINRMVLGFMVMTMDKLKWPGGQVCSAR